MSNGNSPRGDVAKGNGQSAVTALFLSPDDAQSAVRELREVGIPAASISLISRDEDQAEGSEASGAAGVAAEVVQDEAITYRASEELPNDEDLPTTEEAMTGEPPDTYPRIGLDAEADLVRRNEADVDADEDIYTDFPGKPGGISPYSPAAATAGYDIQEPMKNRTPAPETAAAGVGIGSLAGLLVGMAGLAIPGVGPFIAAGPLAGALSGLIAGGAAGGIIGALSTVGVTEEYAREYASRIEQGQTLISVTVDPLSQDLVERVLIANHGDSVRVTP